MFQRYKLKLGYNVTLIKIVWIIYGIQALLMDFVFVFVFKGWMTRIRIN
jgi:hypothetical protein